MELKWFDAETPEEITGKFFDFAYYRNAGKLAITQKWFIDGGLRQRTVNLDRRALMPDVVELLQRFLETAPRCQKRPEPHRAESFMQDN